MNVKPFRIILVVIVLLNMILFAMGNLGGLVFWSIIIIAAILTWKVLPWMEEEM